MAKHARKNLSTRRNSGLESSFFMVDARQVPPEEVLGAGSELVHVQARLIGIARECGWGPAIDAVPQEKALLSRGVDEGDACPDMVDYTCGSEGEHNVCVQHLERQERSPKIIFVQGRGNSMNAFERKVKGGGVRVHHNMEEPAGRSSQLIVSKKGVTAPFQVNGRLMMRVDGEWMRGASRFSSRSIWGVGTRGELDDEYTALLGLHNLMLDVDEGRPAGAHIPLGVYDITDVPVTIDGRQESLSSADFLTNPEVLSIKDLNLLATWAETIGRARNLPEEPLNRITEYREALNSHDPWFERRCSYCDSSYLTALSPDDIAGMEGNGCYDEAARKAIEPLRGPAGEAMAKIFRLAQLQSVGGDDMRLQGFFDSVLCDSESKEDIDAAMKVLYSNYGEEYVAPDMSLDMGKIKRFFEPRASEKIPVVEEYLRNAYELNHDAADRILERFTMNYFRDVGAVHGAGGYMGGLEKLMNPFEGGPRFGAPQGGALEVRNTDILGCKHDLADETYLPYLDASGERPSPEIVREMQLKDLCIAEVTLGRFKTLLTGVNEYPTRYTLSDNRAGLYTGFEPNVETGRVAWLEERLRDVREGTGHTPILYSDYWKGIQGIRDEVYDDYFRRGKTFAAKQ